MPSLAQDAFRATTEYLRDNPHEIGRAFRAAVGLRLGVPIVALRWLAQQAEKSGKIEDLHLDTVPPGLKVAGTTQLMGQPIRFSVVVYVDRIIFTEEELTLAVRVENIELKVIGEPKSPVAALIKSGALNLSNVGTLVSYLPNRPVVIADARDNRVVLDLMRDPAIGMNPVLRKAIGLATGFVTLKSVQSDGGYLDVSFRALPSGLRGMVRAVRENALLPAFGKFLPGSR